IASRPGRGNRVFDDRVAFDAVSLRATGIVRHDLRQRKVLAVRDAEPKAAYAYAVSELRGRNRHRKSSAARARCCGLRQVGLVGGLRRLLRLIPLPFDGLISFHTNELDPVCRVAAFRVAAAAGDEELHEEQEAERDSESDADRDAVPGDHGASPFLMPRPTKYIPRASRRVKAHARIRLGQKHRYEAGSKCSDRNQALLWPKQSESR